MSDAPATAPAPADAVATPYSLRRVQLLLGLSRGAITGLVEGGFVVPARGPRNEWRFSFQDLLLLRTAHALRQAGIAPRRVLRALARLRAALPPTLPLSGLRLGAVGADVVVQDSLGPWLAESGQRLMDFEVTRVDGAVAFLGAPRSAGAAAPPAAQRAEALFRAGQAAEAHDAAAAEAAYRQAVALQPAHVPAYLNLGALLCDDGRCAEAVALYEQALRHCPREPLIYFNHAIALEDQGHLPLAVAAYERALELDPGLADAHYNAGRLLEHLGQAQGALRHFSAYRRMARQADMDAGDV